MVENDHFSGTSDVFHQLLDLWIVLVLHYIVVVEISTGGWVVEQLEAILMQSGTALPCIVDLHLSEFFHISHVSFVNLPDIHP